MLIVNPTQHQLDTMNDQQAFAFTSSHPHGPSESVGGVVVYFGKGRDQHRHSAWYRSMRDARHAIGDYEY